MDTSGIVEGSKMLRIKMEIFLSNGNLMKELVYVPETIRFVG